LRACSEPTSRASERAVSRRSAKKAAVSAPTWVDSSIAAVLERLDKTAGSHAMADAVPTGFPSVDRLLGGGLRTGDLAVLGGDVGSGKSALALAMAVRAAEQGRGVLFFAGETSAERVAERVLAIEGRTRVEDLRRALLDDGKRAAVDAVSHRLSDTRLAIDRLPGNVEALAASLESSRDAELVIVDPLQMLASGRLTQDEELAAAVRRVKRLAVDLGVAFIATAHLPHLAARADRRPQLDDFGALGAIKQHADVVFGLFREGMYDPAQSLEGATELHVLKNRDGATAYADLYFYAQWMRFEDLVDPDR
jgi:replicative DNA helicase